MKKMPFITVDMRRRKLQKERFRETLGKKQQCFGIESQTHGHQERKAEQAGPSLPSEGFTNGEDKGLLGME